MCSHLDEVSHNFTFPFQRRVRMTVIGDPPSRIIHPIGWVAVLFRVRGADKVDFTSTMNLRVHFCPVCGDPLSREARQARKVQRLADRQCRLALDFYADGSSYNPNPREFDDEQPPVMHDRGSLAALSLMQLDHALKIRKELSNEVDQSSVEK